MKKVLFIVSLFITLAKSCPSSSGSDQDESKDQTTPKSNTNETDTEEDRIFGEVCISERPNLHFVGSAEPMPNHDLSGRTDA